MTRLIAARRRPERRAARRARGLALLALPIVLTGVLRTAAQAAASPTWPAATWSVPSDGNVYESSPTAARVGNEVVVAVGTETGVVELLNAANGKELPGWPQHVATAPGQKAAIESSPAIAYLDGPNRPPSIIVGTGSTAVDHGRSVGEVEAFTFGGESRFVFHVGSQPGTANGVISSPAVGDITGDGQLDIVFGSWDHNLYALTSSGALVKGFPVDNKDTIWSSPALAHVRGPADLDDIFIGSDASGANRCFGGFLTDYTYSDGAPKVAWQHCEPQTIWSSPAIGAIDSTGRLAVVVGTGFGDLNYLAGTDDVYAYYADDGAPVPGWPVQTAGPTPGSPAIGTGPNGRPMVVATSWNCNGTVEKTCFFANSSYVEAWTGAGKEISRTALSGATALSSPVLVPLLGERSDDVLVGAAAGLWPITVDPAADGGDAFLFGTSETSPIFNQCSLNDAVALADIPGSGSASGWYVIEACGGPASLGQPGEIASYRLPVQPAAGASLWAMFHGSADHDGVFSP